MVDSQPLFTSCTVIQGNAVAPEFRSKVKQRPAAQDKIFMTNLRTLGINKDVNISELLGENFNPMIYGFSQDEIEKAEALRNILMECLEAPKMFRVKNASDAVKQLQGHAKTLSHEEVWVTFMNSDNTVISTEMIFKGGLNSVVISKREILAKALSKSASAIILYHNHPSGSPMPTESDVNNTRLLRKACDTLEIAMLDHIILGKREYYSFAEERMLKY